MDNSKRSILLGMMVVVLIGGQLGFAQESAPLEEWIEGEIPKGEPLVEADRFFPEHGPLTHYFQRLDS